MSNRMGMRGQHGQRHGLRNLNMEYWSSTALALFDTVSAEVAAAGRA